MIKTIRSTILRSRIELLLLDIFINVLSNSKFFRSLARGFYQVMNDPFLKKRMILVCILFCLLGIVFGWTISVAIEILII